MKKLLLTLIFSSSLGFGALAQTQQQPQQGGTQPNGSNGDQNMPGPGRHRAPPPEALKACESKKSGDSCSFEGRDKKTIDGSCFSPESSKPLACKPAHPPADQQMKQ